jgi:hypothetical protein
VPELRDRMVDAHGGEERWREVLQVMACVSMGGMEFASRFQPSPLRGVEVTISAGCPDVVFADYPSPGQFARFQPSRVWVEDMEGNILRERAAPGCGVPLCSPLVRLGFAGRGVLLRHEPVAGALPAVHAAALGLRTRGAGSAGDRPPSVWTACGWYFLPMCRVLPRSRCSMRIRGRAGAPGGLRAAPVRLLGPGGAVAGRVRDSGWPGVCHPAPHVSLPAQWDHRARPCRWAGWIWTMSTSCVSVRWRPERHSDRGLFSSIAVRLG